MTTREREQRELGQGFLFADLPSESLEDEIRSVGKAADQDRLAWEREVLGFYLSGHPLDAYRAQLDRYADTSIDDLPLKFQGGAENATVGGLVSALKVIPIKKEGRNQGRRMAVFQLEDAGGAVRAVVFPDTFESYERLIEDGAALLVTATLKGDGDHVELMVDEVADLVGMDSKKAAGLRIVLDLDSVDEADLRVHPRVPARAPRRDAGAVRAAAARAVPGASRAAAGAQRRAEPGDPGRARAVSRRRPLRVRVRHRETQWQAPAPPPPPAVEDEAGSSTSFEFAVPSCQSPSQSELKGPDVVESVPRLRWTRTEPLANSRSRRIVVSGPRRRGAGAIKGPIVIVGRRPAGLGPRGTVHSWVKLEFCRGSIKYYSNNSASRLSCTPRATTARHRWCTTSRTGSPTARRRGPSARCRFPYR